MLSVTEKYCAHRSSSSLATTLWSSFWLCLDAGTNIVFARLKVAVLLLAVCLSTAMFWSAGAVALSAGAEPTTRTFTDQLATLTLVQPADQRQADRSEAVDFMVRFEFAEVGDTIIEDLQFHLLGPTDQPARVSLVDFFVFGVGASLSGPAPADKRVFGGIPYRQSQQYDLFVASAVLTNAGFTVRLYPDRSIDSPADQFVLLDFFYGTGEGITTFLDTNDNSKADLDELIELRALASCTSELSRYWSGARLLLGPRAQVLRNISLFGAEETQLVNVVVEHFRRGGSEQLSLSDDMSGERRVERPADARLLLRADIEDSSGTVVHSAIQCDSAGDEDLLQNEMCEYDPQDGTVGALSVYFANPALQFAGSSTSGLQVGERTEFGLRVQPGGGSLRMGLSLLYPEGIEDLTAHWVSQDAPQQESCALPTDDLEGARLNFRDLEGEFCDLAVAGGAEGVSCGALAPVSADSTAVVAFLPPADWQVTADEAGTGEALLREVPANSADGCISLQLPEEQVLSRLALRYSIDPPVLGHFQLRLESEGVLIASAMGSTITQTWNSFEYEGVRENPLVGATIMLCHASGESTSTLRIDDIELETIVLPNCASELPKYWNGSSLLLDPGAQSLQNVSLFGAEETNAVQTVTALVKHFLGDGSEQPSLSDDMSAEQRVVRPADARLLLRADIEDSSGTVVHSAIQCNSAGELAEMCEYDPQDGTVSTRSMSAYFARPALQFVGSSTSGLQIGERTEFSLRVQPSGGSLRMSLSLLYPDGDNHPDTRENFAIFWSSQGFSGQESCALPTDNLEGARLNFRDLEGEFCDLAVVGGAEGTSCGSLAPVPSSSPAVVAFSPPSIWQVTADEAGAGEALLREVPENSAASTGCISLQLPEGQVLSLLTLRYSIDPPVPEHFQLRLESAGVLSDPIASEVDYDSTQEWNRFEYRDSGQNPPVGATIMLCHAPAESTSSLRIDDIELETTALLVCALELSQYWDGARLLLDPGAQSLQSVSLFGAEETNAVQTVNAVVKHFRRDGSEQLSLSTDISNDQRVGRPADARLLLRADIEDSSGTVVHSAIQCDSAEDDDLLETEMCEYDPQQGTVSTRTLSVYFARPALQFGSSASGLQIGESTTFSLRVQPGGDSLRMSLSLLYPDGDNHPETREEFTVFPGSGNSARCALPTSNLEGARLNFRDLEGEFCDLAVVGGAEGTACGLLAPVPSSSPAVVAFSPPTIWQVTADEAGTGEALLREVPANSADGSGCISLQLPEGRVLSRLALRYSIEPAVSEHFQLLLASAGVVSGPFASVVEYNSAQEWNRFEYRLAGQNPPVGTAIGLCHAPAESTSSLRIDDIELETIVLPDRLEQVGMPQILAMPSSRSVIVAQMLRAVDSSGDPVADFAAEVTVAYNPQRSVGLQSTPTVRLLPGFDAFAAGEAALQFEVQLQLVAERVLAIVSVQLGVAGLPPVTVVFEYSPEPAALGDIDGDAIFGPRDGVLMLRYLQPSTEPIVAGVPLQNRVDEALVLGQLQLLLESDLGAQLDVNGSRSVDALDIRILLRYMAGLRGAALGGDDADTVEAAVKKALMQQR